MSPNRPARTTRRPSSADRCREGLSLRHRRRIPVDAEDAAGGGLEQGAGIAAGTEGSIDENGAVTRRQTFQHFSQQDGDVGESLIGRLARASIAA